MPIHENGGSSLVRGILKSKITVKTQGREKDCVEGVKSRGESRDQKASGGLERNWCLGSGG